MGEKAPRKGELLGEGRTAEVFAWGRDRVLKLYRAEMPPEWVDHEARVSRAVYDAGVAAPAVEGVVEIDGRRGIIYERVEGPTLIQWVMARPSRILEGGRILADLHVAMHSREGAGLPPQVAALRHDIEYAPPLEEADRVRLLQRLDRLPTGTAVCHGDFHPDNVVLTPRGPIVLDWPQASSGSPAADVARTELLFKHAALPPHLKLAQRVVIQASRRIFLAAYLRHYRSRRPLDESEVAAWMPIIAGARLNEYIPEEEANLLRLARRS
ncbi:MAG: phosphotransferase [Anaerolineae bacterium]